MTAPFPSPTKVWHDNTYPSISPSRPELSAKGKTVLITGGGTGIGAETAGSFAQAGAAKIALLGRREKPLLDTKALLNEQFPSTTVSTFSADITSKQDIDQAFEDFLSCDKLDILVAAAAIVGPQEFITDVDTDKFMDALNINARGTLNVSQAFITHAAHVNFGPMFTCYNTAKLTVFKIWDAVAFGFPESSVFHIQPGVVDTDMNREAGGVKTMGFEDHVSLPAHFSVWLASPEAKFLNGKFLWANWDGR